MTTVPAWALGQGAGVAIPKDDTPRSTFRFFVERGKEKHIIFLHEIDSALVIWEHQFQLMKKGKLSWNNFATCLRTTGSPCPLCRYAEDMGKFGRSAVQLFSVLDLTPWKDKQGVVHQYSKVILAAKKGTQDILTRRHLELVQSGKPQGLKHAKFKVYRGPDDKSPAVGSEFTFVKYSELGKLPPDDIIPVPIDEFAPNPTRMAEIVTRLKGGAAPTLSSGSSLLDDDDDLPSGAGEFDVASVECDY